MINYIYKHKLGSLIRITGITALDYRAQYLSDMSAEFSITKEDLLKYWILIWMDTEGNNSKNENVSNS